MGELGAGPVHPVVALEQAHAAVRMALRRPGPVRWLRNLLGGGAYEVRLPSTVERISEDRSMDPHAAPVPRHLALDERVVRIGLSRLDAPSHEVQLAEIVRHEQRHTSGIDGCSAHSGACSERSTTSPSTSTLLVYTMPLVSAVMMMSSTPSSVVMDRLVTPSWPEASFATISSTSGT